MKNLLEFAAAQEHAAMAGAAGKNGLLPAPALPSPTERKAA